jgi:hypothetical protein
MRALMTAGSHPRQNVEGIRAEPKLHRFPCPLGAIHIASLVVPLVKLLLLLLPE